MQTQSMHFKARAGQKLADARLQKNLKKLSEKFVTARAAAITELDDFEGTRSAAVERRNRALEHLDLWLETFERNATARGAVVLYAQTPEEATRLIVEIARKHGVRKVTKSKSMVSEEVQLNAAFSAAGVQPVETDLGEYILQINDNEAPSHIIAPVIHKDKEEISALFAKAHGTERKSEITQLTREAREVLRGHFLSADMGVTGANFLIAETGTRRPRDQRRQRRHVHDHAAQGARRADWHRKGAADAGGCRNHHAPAAAFCDRTADFELLLAPHGAAPGG